MCATTYGMTARLAVAGVTGVMMLALAACVAGAADGEREIVLEEQLNRDWHDEPLNYALEWGEGEAHIDSLALHGPDGPMPMQLTDVELWPGTRTVQSATLWLMADLEALTRNVYTLRYGPEPDAESDEQAEPASDLRVATDGRRAEMSTSRFGVRLRLGGQRYSEPQPAANVPAPIEALRLADGTWFGDSTLHGPTRVRAWSGELTERGPVFAEASYRYEYADGNTLDLTVRLFERADRAQFDADAAEDSRDDSLRIDLSRNLSPLTVHIQKLWWHRRDIYPEDAAIGDWASVPVAELEQYPPQRGNYPESIVQGVSPWAPWWDDLYQPVVRLGIGDGERELHIARRDPGAWVEPVEQWGQNGSADTWAAKALPIMHEDGERVYIELDLRTDKHGGGVRKFDIADSEATTQVGWRQARLNHRGDPGGSQVIPYQEPLNVVKDYVLDWPSETTSPRIFMNEQEIAASRPDEVDPELRQWLERRASAPGPLPHNRDTNALSLWLLTGDDEVARERVLAERLNNHLGLLGDFDKMRHTVRVAALYDAVIDSDLVTSEQRRLLRAQMAYLAYQVAHPATWSPERGWNSGNLNMTVSYSMLGRGIMASALSDHPHAEQWMQPANYFMEQMLDVVGPAGEWPESTSYSNLSVGEVLIFGIMATRAGFADYVNDPRLRRAVTYLTKINTPPDPRLDGERTTPRYGRSGGRPWALDGAIARATLESDPEFSRQMQWMSRDVYDPADRPTQPRRMELGGFEHLYLDPSLPAEPPDWHTEKFPYTGALFRHGFATEHEHYHLLIGGDHMAMIYPGQAGALVSVYADREPVGGSFFGRYGNHAEFLVNGISLARDPADHVRGETPFHYRGAPRSGWFFDPDRPQADFEREEAGDVNVSAFAALPRQDYAAVDVAMIRPRANNLAIPDDIPWPELIAGEGEPPLWWRRQALFIKDDDPAAAGNYLIVRDTLRGDQPTQWTFWTASEKLGTPEQVADREAFLADAPGGEIVEPRELHGDRFTAMGEWGMDLEYYIAAPSDTPRHTLRWGRTWRESPIYGVEQYQDLLHLQREGDGVYYVALFPRNADAETDPPQFSTLGDGRVIKVEGEFGTDWGFLSGLNSEAQADGLHFTGKAGGVQHRGDETAISLGAAGSVRTAAVTLEAQHAATVRWLGEPGEVRGNAIRVELPREHEGVELRLELPEGAYAASDDAVTLERDGEMWRVTAPAEVTTFALDHQ